MKARHGPDDAALSPAQVADRRVIADRYRLTRPIGRGGMSAVWEGSDLRLDRPIAVKLIYKTALAPVHEAVCRFNREARITARLRHPGVPVVYDFGNDADDLFMVMEYVEGQTVADVIVEQSPLPVGWAALIGAQVRAVLSAAHRASLIHATSSRTTWCSPRTPPSR